MFYATHQKDLNEDRPILSAAKCRCHIRYVSKFTAASRGSPCNSTALVLYCNHHAGYVWCVIAILLLLRQ